MSKISIALLGLLSALAIATTPLAAKAKKSCCSDTSCCGSSCCRR